MLKELSLSAHPDYKAQFAAQALILMAEGMRHLYTLKEAVFCLKLSFHIVCKVLVVQRMVPRGGKPISLSSGV